MLTAAHVIGGLFPWPTQQTNVVGYGDLQADQPHELLTTALSAVSSDLGRLERSIPPTLSQSCSIDAAIARVSGNRELRNHLNEEPVQGVRDIRPLLDTDIPVEMFGACSNRRHGILNTAPVTERLRLGNTPHRIFYEQARLVRSVSDDAMAVPGDSGSVLVDENHFAIAMVVGVIKEGETAGCALATPLAPAVEALNVEIYAGDAEIRSEGAMLLGSS